MDISIEKKKVSFVRKYWYLVAAALLIITILSVRHVIGGASYVAEKKSLRIAQVEQGEFYVDIRSNGQLAAREFNWIPAEVNGHIEKILVRAGDSVEIDTPLLQLRNQSIIRDAEKAEWEYKQIAAESHATVKSLESQLLQLESDSLRAQLAYKSNKLKMEAEKKLIAKGHGLVSEIEHQRSIFAVQEQKQIWDSFEKRMKKMRENLDAQESAGQARVARLKSDLDKALWDKEMLTVRARSKGLIQEMNLELGQKLNIGDTVATVADTSELIAELQVQELQVQKVIAGQEVIIDTRKNKLIGKVIRVHPSVNNGMVQVDVDFVDELTPETRIALSVEGTIRTTSVPDALYVKKPAYVQPNSSAGIFRVSSDGYQAERIPVRLGDSSVNNIQILDGLGEGEKIIISDVSGYVEHEKLLIR